jgi:hypothetical protein
MVITPYSHHTWQQAPNAQLHFNEMVCSVILSLTVCLPEAFRVPPQIFTESVLFIPSPFLPSPLLHVFIVPLWCNSWARQHPKLLLCHADPLPGFLTSYRIPSILGGHVRVSPCSLAMLYDPTNLAMLVCTAQVMAQTSSASLCSLLAPKPGERSVDPGRSPVYPNCIKRGLNGKPHVGRL